jgi:hypothetical protein
VLQVQAPVGAAHGRSAAPHPLGAPGERLERPAAPEPRWLRPGWPLTALLLGYPVWWALGFSTFVLPVLALPMAFALLRRRRLRVPRGAGLWMLFLVWVALGAGVLWADAPGAVPGGSTTRLLTWGLRLSYYLAATVALLYVGNLSERELPTRRVVRLLAAVFVITTAGGLLGMLAPGLEWTSVAEVVLPASITGAIDAVHPGTAQVQDILAGGSEARPKAPFAYTNEWGANLVLLLPFFCAAWLGRDAGWRRYAAPVVLLVATVALVASLNRGAWIGVLLAIAYVAVRSAAAGRVAALAALVGATVVGALVLVLSPLGGLVQDRLDSPHSNERRGLLAAQTVESATASPVVGFGSTRPVQGNLSSIATGASGDCPKCEAPPLGTHGQMWLLVFSQGFVGAALFLGFLLRRFLRHWRDPRPEVVAAMVTLVLFALFGFYYNLLPFPLLTLSLGLAVAWRLGRQRADGVRA